MVPAARAWAISFALSAPFVDLINLIRYASVFHPQLFLVLAGAYLVALAQADCLFHLERNKNRGDTGDPYPGGTGNNRFDDASAPHSRDKPWQLDRGGRYEDQRGRHVGKV
jgi:hypothetical protein